MKHFTFLLRSKATNWYNWILFLCYNGSYCAPNHPPILKICLYDTASAFPSHSLGNVEFPLLLWGDEGCVMCNSFSVTYHSWIPSLLACPISLPESPHERQPKIFWGDLIEPWEAKEAFHLFSLIGGKIFSITKDHNISWEFLIGGKQRHEETCFFHCQFSS